MVIPCLLRASWGFFVTQTIPAVNVFPNVNPEPSRLVPSEDELILPICNAWFTTLPLFVFAERNLGLRSEAAWCGRVVLQLRCPFELSFFSSWC